jgi:hypothetical protein
MEAYLPVARESEFIGLTVLALKAAGTRDLHGGTKGLSNEMARRPVVGRIPMQRLMLDLL